MCGARLSDDNELKRHNETMHPNMSGKKAGERDDGKPDLGRKVGEV
jgi:hypothetical protein